MMWNDEVAPCVIGCENSVIADEVMPWPWDSAKNMLHKLHLREVQVLPSIVTPTLEIARLATKSNEFIGITRRTAQDISGAKKPCTVSYCGSLKCEVIYLVKKASLIS